MHDSFGSKSKRLQGQFAAETIDAVDVHTELSPIGRSLSVCVRSCCLLFGQRERLYCRCYVLSASEPVHAQAMTVYMTGLFRTAANHVFCPLRCTRAQPPRWQQSSPLPSLPAGEPRSADRSHGLATAWFDPCQIARKTHWRGAVHLYPSGNWPGIRAHQENSFSASSVSTIASAAFAKRGFA